MLTHLPGKVTYKEIDEMIKTVDENGDGKINYQEFRVMIGAKPNLTADHAKKMKSKEGEGKEGKEGKDKGGAKGGANANSANAITAAGATAT